MDIDREADMSPSLVVEPSPASSERKEITNWLRKIHRQIGHRDNRTLVRLFEPARDTSMSSEDDARHLLVRNRSWCKSGE